jgi:ADP-ribosylglycohydrolase
VCQLEGTETFSSVSGSCQKSKSSELMRRQKSEQTEMSLSLIEKRAVACIQAVAVGDAMGKMTEGYRPEEILQNYGEQLQGFRQPLQPKSGFSWRYAEVTDDTVFTMLTAESITEKGRVDRRDIIQRILKTKIKGWPGWDDFYDAAQAGEDKITDFARLRDRNGAPMRVSPIGIINKPENLEKIVDDVDLACSMTHGATSALSAACAVAAAISAAVEGWEKEQTLKLAVKAARLGEHLGNNDARPPADRILIGTDFVKSYEGSQLAKDLRSVLNPGFLAYEAVPYALSLAYGIPNAKEVILGAVNQGGDADSTASMAGSIAAALYPDSLPQEWVREVENANNLNLSKVATELARLRQ